MDENASVGGIANQRRCEVIDLDGIKARCEKATAGHTCTETPYGCLRCESETDSLDAECLLLVAEVERMRKVEAAASAINAHFPPSGVAYINAAFDADIKRLRAALDAAEGTA
jgi:hypothetical protein